MNPTTSAGLLNPDLRPAAVAPAQTALVVRSDSTGVWCVPAGGNRSAPIGPCRGGAPGRTRLPVGTVVLLVRTDYGPWVAAFDEEPL